MKKEYFILALIIIALSAYLVLHKQNKTNYNLPDIPKLSDSDITALNINTGGKNISFTKEYDKWRIGDKKYPADAEKLKSMLKVIESLNLSALVSENNDLTRYKLDKKNRIKVVAKNGSKLLRQIKIGKTAPTYRHTFVQIGNDKNIYYANGNFRSDFDNDIDGFRDKKILSFDKTIIKKIIIKKGNKQNEFFLKTAQTKENDKNSQDKIAKNNQKNKASNKNIKSKNTINRPVKPENIKFAKEEKWESENGSSFKQNDIKDLISRLSDFKCNHYTDNDSKDLYKAKIPLCTIILEPENDKEKNNINEKKIKFLLYAKNKNGDYPGICSENKYPFLLDSYEGDDIISKADTLLGIKKLKKNKNK